MCKQRNHYSKITNRQNCAFTCFIALIFSFLTLLFSLTNHFDSFLNQTLYVSASGLPCLRRESNFQTDKRTIKSSIEVLHPSDDNRGLIKNKIKKTIYVSCLSCSNHLITPSWPHFPSCALSDYVINVCWNLRVRRKLLITNCLRPRSRGIGVKLIDTWAAIDKLCFEMS